MTPGFCDINAHWSDDPAIAGVSGRTSMDLYVSDWKGFLGGLHGSGLPQGGVDDVFPCKFSRGARNSSITVVNSNAIHIPEYLGMLFGSFSQAAAGIAPFF